ncbi:cyclophilin-like domain-containing protein, partial [Baffinella frigidus]
MSQIYQNLPPTNGKVVLNTTCGDIDVELWSKEAPMACRNFIQLCMEGYYDNLMFHRIIAKFMIQGGDPTGTGQGGESIFGEPFKDEVHSRLRFSVRGLVAMANGGKDDNGSQFFLTLAPCEWLNGKHTIFGKVTGKTIYNLDAMGEYEVDDQDKPLYPPRILSSEVLNNPFDDIVPRDKGPAKAEVKVKVRGVKKKDLLSFADDEDAPGLAEDRMEADGEVAPKKRMVAAHDVLDDARMVRENEESIRTVE